VLRVGNVGLYDIKWLYIIYTDALSHHLFGANRSWQLCVVVEHVHWVVNAHSPAQQQGAGVAVVRCDLERK
jgi:hypothetical protein